LGNYGDSAFNYAKPIHGNLLRHVTSIKCTVTVIPVVKDAGSIYFDDELNRYFFFGRIAFGIATELGPIAAIGNATYALEKGHDVIDSLAKGAVGNSKP